MGSDPPITQPLRMMRFARSGYLLIVLPGILVLSVAMLLFESSANMTIGDFTHLIRSLTDSPERAGAAEILTEVRARYIWLATVMLNVAVPIYAMVVCGLIIVRAHSRRRLMLVVAVGVVLCVIGFIILLHSATTKNVLYRVVFGFTFLNLQSSGRFSPGFLERVDTIVSMMNGQTIIAPIIAVLAAASTLAPPEDGQAADREYYASQMRSLKEVLNAGSTLLVSGVLNMGAWLRWPASLVSEKGAQEAILGVALAITLFWGTTFTLMLVATYGPAAIYLGLRARALLFKDAEAGQVQDPDQWLREHGLFMTLGEHVPQLGVMLGPVLAGPLSSLLMAPLTPSGQ